MFQLQVKALQEHTEYHFHLQHGQVLTDASVSALAEPDQTIGTALIFLPTRSEPVWIIGVRVRKDSPEVDGPPPA